MSGPHREDEDARAGVGFERKLEAGLVIIERQTNLQSFDTAIEKWRGSATERMQSLSFASTDEFIEAVRGR